MHHTSLGWRCFAAEAMKAAAPDDDVSDDATPEQTTNPVVSMRWGGKRSTASHS